MKKLFRNPIFWAVAAFLTIVAVQLPFTTSRGADWLKANDVVLSVDGPKAAITKLESNDDDIYTKLNLLKEASAGTTAPSSPNEGQFWFDNVNDILHQYYASTWVPIWSYASTTDNTWEGLIDANSGTVDNLEATTITSPYATVTDIDVVTADIITSTLGSATISTLTTSNWSQDTATFNTLTASTSFMQPTLFTVLTVAAGFTVTPGNYKIVTWGAETVDTINAWEGTTNPTRITVPTADFELFTVCASFEVGAQATNAVTGNVGMTVGWATGGTFAGEDFVYIDSTGSYDLSDYNPVLNACAMAYQPGSGDWATVHVYSWADTTFTAGGARTRLTVFGQK